MLEERWGFSGAENPLDMVENLVQQEDWTLSRQSPHELTIACPGHWTIYQIHCLWLDDMQALHVSSGLEITIANNKRAEVMALISAINTKIWVGHFELATTGTGVAFRHCLLLRGTEGASGGQIEDLIDIAVGECDRFYPAFQFVVWGDKSPQEALAASLLETKGNA